MRCLYFVLFILITNSTFGQTFNEVSNNIGIHHVYKHLYLMGGGCAFFDYDGDGDDDLYFSGGLDRDYLYRNDGNGAFTEVGSAAGLDSTANYYTFGVITGDIENDGDRDIFITTFVEGKDTSNSNKWLLSNNKLFINNGNGTFTDNSIAAGIVDSMLSTSASFGDFNKDGFLDIYVCNYVREYETIEDSSGTVTGIYAPGYANYLYMNNGNGTFSRSATTYMVADTGAGLAVSATDYDNDGDVDIYLSNDFGEWNRPNALHQNNYPNPSFTDVSVPSGANVQLFGMGIAIGDYNEDLNLDYYITNIGRNSLLHNNGDGTFTDTTTFAQVENEFVDTLLTTGWGCAFLDYDNDSYLDLFVANGQMPIQPEELRKTHPEDPNILYHNNRDGTFSDTTNYFNLHSATIAHGMAFSDYDQDGDVDIAMAVLNHPIPSDTTPHSLFYRNDSIGINHSWLGIKLVGTVSNRDAFGAHLLIYAGGRTFLREVDGGSSHASQNSSVQHIGLGTISTIDSVVVIWPNTGRETFQNINSNQIHTLTEGLINPLTFIAESDFTIFPNPTNSMVHIKMDKLPTGSMLISLQNQLGQTIFQKKVPSSLLYNIDLSSLNLSTGTYWLKIGNKPAKKINYIKG